MQLRFAAGTREYLASVAPAVRRDLRQALRLLSEDPRHPSLDLKQLRAKGTQRIYRVRVRDYRIVFSPRNDQVYVWRILHRSEGYGWLERLDPN